MLDEQPDPFDELTNAELVAFIYREEGEAGLREALAHDGGTPNTRWRREWVLDVADELSRAGLRKAARITVEVAAVTPLMTDMVFCPYMVPPYTDNPRSNENNIKSWLRSQEQRQLRWQRQREAKRKQTGNGNRRQITNGGQR